MPWAAYPVSNGRTEPGCAGIWPVPVVRVVTAGQAAEVGQALAAESDGLIFVDEGDALRPIATRQTHANVLQHLAGYLKTPLSAADKQQLQECIQQYRIGLVPLAAPVDLLKGHFLRHPHTYISDQAYLYPYPEEIRLRHLF